MPKLSLAEELKSLIRATARELDQGTTSRTAAEEVYAELPELILNFSKEWTLEKLTALISDERRKLRDKEDRTVQLGFHLPKTFMLRDGSREKRDEMTLRKFRQYRAKLWNAGHPKLAEVDRIITLWNRYAKKNKGITWGEVCAKELGIEYG